MTTEYLCYTDGSCKAGENAHGGWGFHIKSPDGPPIEGHGHALKTQAKVMEYAAVAEALASLPHGVRATVFSDNQALVQNLANSLEGWRLSQWAHVDPAIADIVQRIDSLILERRLTLTWQWLRGHNGNDGNERADALAAQGAREAKSALEPAGTKDAQQEKPRQPYRNLKDALRDWRKKKAGASPHKRRK